MPKEYGRLLITEDDDFGQKYLEKKTCFRFNEFWWREDMLNNIKADIIKKYGNNYGKAILEGKVLTGMTKEMCLKAWGDEKWWSRSWSKQTNSGTWEHPKGQIKFTNGKVSSVKVY